MHGRHDFDAALGDLGGDVEGLEEGGLLGSHAGVLGLNCDIHRGDSSSSGGGCNLREGGSVTGYFV